MAGVLLLNDIIDVADRFGGDIPDSLDMFGDEQKMVRIDVPMLNEARASSWDNDKDWSCSRGHTDCS